MPITRQQLKMTCPNLAMKLCTANTHLFHPQRHLSLFWRSQFLTPSSLMRVAYLRFRLDPVLKYRPEQVMYKHKIHDTWLEFQQWQQTPPVSLETRYIHVGGSRDPGLGSYLYWPYSILQMGQNTLCQTRRGPGLELIEIWLTPPGLRGASEGATMSTTLSGLDAGTKLSFSGKVDDSTTSEIMSSSASGAGETKISFVWLGDSTSPDAMSCWSMPFEDTSARWDVMPSTVCDVCSLVRGKTESSFEFSWLGNAFWDWWFGSDFCFFAFCSSWSWIGLFVRNVLRIHLVFTLKFPCFRFCSSSFSFLGLPRLFLFVIDFFMIS